MANHKSALKAARQAVIKRQRNRAARARARSQVKQLRQAVASGDSKLAGELLAPTISLLDRSAQSGMLHRNNASRTKSRLTRHVNNMAAPAASD
jgi:small subunit ribosomal protein S20